jgi:hypothetical protein
MSQLQSGIFAVVEAATDQCEQLIADAQTASRDESRIRKREETVWPIKVASEALHVAADPPGFLIKPLDQQLMTVMGLQTAVTLPEVRSFLVAIASHPAVDSKVRGAANAVLASTDKKSKVIRSKLKNLVWFTGRINRIDEKEETAYATLHDDERREYGAEFALSKIKEANLKEGDTLICVVIESTDKTTMTLLPRRKRELSLEEANSISRKITEVAKSLGCPNAFALPRTKETKQ